MNTNGLIFRFIMDARALDELNHRNEVRAVGNQADLAEARSPKGPRLTGLWPKLPALSPSNSAPKACEC